MKNKIIRIASASAIFIMCFILNISTNVKTVHAKTEKMKSVVYLDVIKDGDTAYCNCFDIYKVDLKTGEVTTLVVLEDKLETVVENLSLNGDWLYYYEWTCLPGRICRVNTKTGLKEIIGEDDDVEVSGNKYSSIFYEEYAIEESKLYCNMGYLELNDNDQDGILPMKMDLDGSNKEEADISIDMRIKNSNAHGYTTYVEIPVETKNKMLTVNYLIIPEKNAFITDYTTSPGKYYLFANRSRIPERTFIIANNTTNAEENRYFTFRFRIPEKKIFLDNTLVEY